GEGFYLLKNQLIETGVADFTLDTLYLTPDLGDGAQIVDVDLDGIVDIVSSFEHISYIRQYPEDSYTEHIIWDTGYWINSHWVAAAKFSSNCTPKIDVLASYDNDTISGLTIFENGMLAFQPFGNLISSFLHLPEGKKPVLFGWYDCVPDTFFEIDYYYRTGATLDECTSAEWNLLAYPGDSVSGPCGGWFQYKIEFQRLAGGDSTLSPRVDSVFLIIDSCEACSTWIDSIWFSEETDCNDSNIVEICYILSSTCPESLFNVNVRMRPDSLSGWMSAGEGWFATLTDTAGDFGAAVDTGLHCFYWIMNEDTSAEGREWEVEVGVILGSSTFDCFIFDSLTISLESGSYGYPAGLAMKSSDSLIFSEFHPPYSTEPNKLYIYDLSTRSIVRTLYNAGYPGWHGWKDLAFDGEFIYGATWCYSTDKILKIDPTDGHIVSESPPICYNLAGVTYDPINDCIWVDGITSGLTSWRLYKLNKLTLEIEQSFEIEHIDDHHPEGLAFAMGKIWITTDNHGYFGWLDFGSLHGDTIPVVITCVFPAEYGINPAEGLTSDGFNFYYANWSLHKIFVISGYDSPTPYISTSGPLDSRPPSVHLLCPGDSAISAGDVVHLEWSVIDTFWNDDPCSLHIYGIGCSYDTTIIVPDTFYDWIVPPSAAGCDTIWFVVAARDSFCNWGRDSCAIPPICRTAWGLIECAPCESFTGCYDQFVRWIVTVLDGIDIDTMRVYLTLEIFHADATADTFYLHEPSDSISFSCVEDTICSRVIITISGFEFESGDSVWTSLDSLYNEAGCFTDFSE
ncbi:hypothetical protein J7M00_09625, partial [bacterium]|nr:hypothetical protein [bacterium]